tara:strand:+ start:2074 stop:2295 length:222 start_codon:yes stop_codon:yes gene_type:complete
MDLYQKVERVIKDYIIEHQAEVYKGEKLLKQLRSDTTSETLLSIQMRLKSKVMKTGAIDLYNVFPDYTELPDD